MTAKAPSCQLKPDKRPDKRKKCQAVLLDNTEKKVLIVYEKSYPKRLRRWGLPKGKFKTGEGATDCVHREVCEEVGIEVDKYPHIYRKKGADHIIVFNKPAAEIKLHIGPEIQTAKWVDLEWLKKDVKAEIAKVAKKCTGRGREKCLKGYPYKYNYDIRRVIPKVK